MVINPDVIFRMYAAPSIDLERILKYAEYDIDDEDAQKLLRQCLREVDVYFVFRVTYIILPCSVTDDTVDLTFTTVKSATLAKALEGCDRCVVFVATVGATVDRLVRQYRRTAPEKSLMFQAIGTERIERLCEVFRKDIAKELKAKTKQRVSPGYGDLPLEINKDIFDLLSCSCHAALTLSENGVISPSKSISAFIGIKK